MSAQVEELKQITELKIDTEFKNLIPELSEKEYRILEDSILERGCLNPIITWNNTIVDGHNRYQICCKLDHAFEIKPIEFTNKNEAKIWIIHNQFGRRNLNKFQRCELALQMEALIQEQAKKNQSAGGGAVPQISAKPVDTREKLADIADVSHDTINKVKKIITKASEEDREQIRLGATTINAVHKKLERQENGQNNQDDGAIYERLTKRICDSIGKLSKMQGMIPSQYKKKLHPVFQVLKRLIDETGHPQACA